jgi:myo-inositol 2-dehydrogenase/D-chiro-inositol 1-dehydrogenase
MSELIRYGIVGVGAMGREHIRNIQVVPGGELVAVADPHGPSIEAARELAPDVAIHGDLDQLLARDDLDALVVATPNHTHRAIVERAAHSNLHLLIEKPFATTTAHALELERILEGYPAVAWVGMEYRYSPPVARLIEDVRSGVAGDPRMVAIREHRFPFLPKVGDWNRFSRNTGGTLVEKCCHFFDLQRHILQAEPVRVYASGAMDVNHLDERYDGEQPDILDNAYVIVDFEGGRRAMLDLCMFAEQSRHQTELVVTGPAGQVEVGQPEGVVWIGERELPTHPAARRDPARLRAVEVPVDETAMAVGTHHGATYYQHVAFQRAVRGESPVEVTAHDGLVAVAIGEAAERSVEQHRPIDIAEILEN